MRIRNLGLLLAFAGLLPAQDQAKEHVLFARDEVHEMHLRFEQTDWFQQMWATFQANGEDVPYIEASFEWRDVKFDKVGVRIKGNSTARVNSIKKPFRIKFNEFTKGQKIEGIGSINLNNCNMDPSMARELPYFELARAAAVRASAAAAGPMAIPALEALVVDLLRCHTPHTSPAGRPTFIEISPSELLRRFHKTPQATSPDFGPAR